MTREDLPEQESEQIEFKSSATGWNALKKKIHVAASAFWNSGGGTLYIGLNDEGKVDGGIEPYVGSQKLGDWVDQLLHEVQPTGDYKTWTINSVPPEAGALNDECVVLAIEFLRSSNPPHMSSDHRFYIRAGAHSAPASQFILDALIAKRTFNSPRLAHILRLKPDDHQVIQLGVIAINDTPAENVQITLDPLPAIWSTETDVFPVQVRVIDRQHPFFLDLTTFTMADQRLGHDVKLRVTFTDSTGKARNYDAPLAVTKEIAPWTLGGNTLKNIAKSLDKLAKGNAELKRIREGIDRMARISEPTGLSLSHATVHNIQYATGLSKSPARRQPSEMSWKAFRDVLGVDFTTAHHLESHFLYGRPEKLKDVAGMTQELEAQLRRNFVLDDDS